MTLVLAMRRSPEGVALETRQIAHGEMSIGRGPANDWTLADPDRVLSKRHCVITALGNAWEVTDLSANGTFVNDETERLAPQSPRLLGHGDRVIFGSYEIEGLLENKDRLAFPANPAPPHSLSDDRLTSDPFPPIEQEQFGISLLTEQSAAPFGATTPDHTSAMAAGFKAPRTSLDLLPMDWDADITPPRPDAVPSVPAQTEQPAPPPHAAPQPAALQPTASEPATPEPVAPSPIPADAQSAFAAFAAGAGMTGTVAPPDPLGMLQSLGAAFRSVVSGLRQVMIARASIKSEFRIEQTMIQAVGNNPLKFSADDDDALAALLGVGRRGGMTAERAIGDAMRDMRMHELAVANAMQQAARDMLAALAPQRIDEKVPRSFLDALPERRKARLWDSFVALHRDTDMSIAENFDTVFGKSFVRAYERAMRDAAASDIGGLE